MSAFSKTVIFRLTPEERAELDELAREAHLPLSMYMRALVREAIERRGEGVRARPITRTS